MKTRILFTLCLATAALAPAVLVSGVAASPRPGANPAAPGQAIDYHVRIVRVSGSTGVPGAALGPCGTCGIPVLVPSDEVWGTREQLDALARGLGGTTAAPVTGYVVRPAPDGTAHYDATVYAGEAALDLVFAARTEPGAGGADHVIDLTLRRHADAGPALAETRIVSSSGRTVAIAAPTPVAGEWLVLAVSPMDTTVAVDRMKRASEVTTMKDGIEPPQLEERAEPEYPTTARTAGTQGKVVLQAVIDEQGIPRAVSVLKLPEGGEELAGAAVGAVERWRYRPAMREGKPVPVYFTVVVQFRLQEKDPEKSPPGR